MTEILLTGYWRSKKKTVRLTMPLGNWENIFIMVDNRFHGEFIKRNGEWWFWLNSKSDLCSNDIEVMREEIEKNI